MSSNKRGSHVGMILSFVIFVIFLIFLYSILEPILKTEKDKEALLDYLEIELVKEFSTEITTMIIMNKTGIDSDRDCIRLRNIIENITEAGAIPENLIIKDSLNNILSYSLQGPNNLEIENLLHVGFFKIYSSEKLERSPIFGEGPCQVLRETDDYLLGLTRTNEHIFETKIIDSINTYEADYENFKSDLKIPAGSEFGFSFTYSNGTTIGTEEKDISISIYAEEIPIQYIDTDANFLPGFINIKVW